ncbi:WecE Predicted pyridoxal phosphate-dependent enzyme apparently involved in regulation of cell wall biogenesis [Candidatus Nanopelagicaceae bacterium]
MIPYGRQSISDADIAAVSKALRGDFLTTGPLVEEFESLLTKYLDTPTLVVSSGTAALHCAYAAIGLKPGDEIITPPLTFIATQATAALLGATVRFADIDPETGTIDPKEVVKQINNKTRAVVAVDYAGHPAELKELKELTKNANIILIEDAAHSIGSKYYGQRIGGIADITTFSFFPTKNMTTGEGGAVSSPHPEFLERARKFSRQGLVRDKESFILKNEGDWHQEVHEFGLNYRLPDILCALGISQLAQIEKFKEIRETVFSEYLNYFQGISKLQLPTKREYTDPMWHLFPVRVPKGLRRPIFDELRRNQIGVQVNYLPGHLQPVFARKGFALGDFPVAEDFYQREISLPMHTNMEMLNENYFKKVSRIIEKVLAND